MRCLFCVLGLFCMLAGAAEPPSAGDGGRDEARAGVPNDWSHRHVVFSRPATFERQAEVQNDARFWHHTYQSTMPMYLPDRYAAPRAVQAAGAGRDRDTEDGPDNPDDSGKLTSGPAVKIDWGESVSTTALTYGAAGNYPAKYSFDVASTTPDCTNDFVVFALPAGAATKANLVAYRNLYVDNAGTGKCAGTLPVALFTYNASQNGGSLLSSPALSLNGKQIAFVENAASAQFHVVKWKAGDVAGTFGTPFNAAKMVNCAVNGAVAPCEYSVIYATGTASLSSAWIDYATDTAYVSNNAGKIVAIKPVFGGGQPVVQYTVTVAGSSNMTSPVYDSVSKNVFVADGTGKLYYIRTTAGSAGACAVGAPPCLGTPALNAANGNAIVEAPVVDSGSGTVFVFSNHAPAGANATVVQTDTKLSFSRVATIGPVGSQNVLAGTFDNNYFNSPSTGLLYMCGTLAGNIPQLYGIKFTGTLMNVGAAAKGPLALATATTSCSALTEVLNVSSNEDELYLSVANKCSAAITGGCVKRFDITAGFPASSTNAAAETGGTSGMVVDNVSNGPGGNVSQTNIYFVTKSAQTCSKYTSGTSSTGNCAVKLTQNALQ